MKASLPAFKLIALTASFPLSTLSLVGCGTSGPIPIGTYGQNSDIGNRPDGGRGGGWVDAVVGTGGQGGSVDTVVGTGGRGGGSVDAMVGTGGQGGSVDAAVGTGGAAGAATGQAGAAGSGGAAGNTDNRDAQVACGTLDDEAGTPVEVVVTNERSNTIYVGSRTSECNIEKVMTITDANGNRVQHEDAACSTCATVMHSPGCVNSCGRSPLYELAPGASVTLHWAGTYSVAHMLPSECFVEPWMTGCIQRLRIPAGSYEMAIVASASYGCQFDEPCLKPYGAAFGTGEVYEVKTRIELPTQNRVQIAFRE